MHNTKAKMSEVEMSEEESPASPEKTAQMNVNSLKERMERDATLLTSNHPTTDAG